jgi:hypothetical protein
VTPDIKNERPSHAGIVLDDERETVSLHPVGEAN